MPFSIKHSTFYWKVAFGKFGIWKKPLCVSYTYLFKQMYLFVTTRKKKDCLFVFPVIAYTGDSKTQSKFEISRLCMNSQSMT